MPELDPLLLSRIQFAFTSINHFFFVPVTIGLALLTALLQTWWYRNKNPDLLRLTRMPAELLSIDAFAALVVFAVGGLRVKAAKPAKKKTAKSATFRQEDIAQKVGRSRAAVAKVAAERLRGVVEQHAFPHVGVFSRTAATRPWMAYSWAHEVLLSRAYAWFGLMGLATFGVLLTGAVAAVFFWRLYRISGRFWVCFEM